MKKINKTNHILSKIFFIQKQLSIIVFIKRFSENMQQIYRRTPMPKCDFNKVALPEYYRNTYGGLLLLITLKIFSMASLTHSFPIFLIKPLRRSEKHSFLCFPGGSERNIVKKWVRWKDSNIINFYATYSENNVLWRAIYE